ncbi:class I adenylate-forming enzyme family protein [Desulfitobacterium sp. Sab5]|uniref:class I adenylate-forming enzyme family protein n=1 Tax=Desulfitobacterium nosdiversum TaxID=3375356 RepID=UPI003CF58D6A
MFPINVGYFLTLNANRYPNKTALLYKGRRFTYREINDRVNRLAHSLIDLGITKGDKVGFIFPNCNQIVELLFALFKIGAVAVPLNHRLVSQEIKYLVDTAECKAFVYSDMYADKVAEVKKEFNQVKMIVSSGQSFAGEHSYEQLCAHVDNTEPNVTISGNDLSRIQFTGGTTGRSKGVMRTHESDIFQTISIMTQDKMGANPDEVVMVQCPLHHQGGMSWLLSAIATGAEFVFCDVFNPEDILKQIQDYKVTYLLLLPPVTYLRLYDVPNIKTFDLTSVKYVQMSAGGTSPDIIFKTYNAFPNCEVNYGWGQTESGAGTNIVLTRELAHTHPEKTKSIGKAMPLIELRIVDEEGKDVPVGEVGECIARGPSVMSGYYNQPELTAKAFKDGWVHTGDMFKQDEEGYYYIMDRKKDMIKTGGENVFAQEVESVIRSHSAILDCAVIGVPDPVFGEAVMAVVKLRTGGSVTLEEIQELCKSQLSSYKKPRYVDFVESFPIDSAGKIQKFRLREMYKAFSRSYLCKSS